MAPQPTATRIRFRCRCGRSVSCDQTSPSADTQLCTQCQVRNTGLVRHRATLRLQRRRTC